MELGVSSIAVLVLTSVAKAAKLLAR